MSSALWSAAETRGRVPWIGVDDPSEMQRLQAEHSAKMQIISNLQLGGSENLAAADDPRHALQEKRGLADLWYVDGVDIFCHPILVPSYLQEFDDANEKVGGERSPQKTEVIYYVEDLDAAPRLLPKQPLETRFAAVIETASTTYLEAFDSENQATAKLCFQKTAQAADEAWQQTGVSAQTCFLVVTFCIDPSSRAIDV